MNKKAFTLVELLATIVIIGLVAGIGTIAYTTLISQSETKVFESYEDTMHAEAAYKLTMKYTEVNWEGDKATLRLNDLEIDPINNPNDSNDLCPNSYVEVTKSYVGNVLSLNYKVYLICNSYNSDGSHYEEYDN